MTELFLKIINISISTSWLILAALILRFALKKAPRWISVLLWGVVALRLICPFSIESALSLIPSAQTIPDKVLSGPSFKIQSGIAPIDLRVNDYLGDRYFEGVTVPNNNGTNVMTVFSIIWLIGIAALLIYTTVSYIRLRGKVKTAVLMQSNIFQSESVNSPFVLGIIKPKIYLPFSVDPGAFEHVITHEQAHISRRDYLWKPIGFLLLAFYWFNPLMWLAYALLCRDIELACDEKVVKSLDTAKRADYSQALLTCSVNRSSIISCPLSFSEVGTKERVKYVLNYKKPTLWIIIAALVICAVAAVCFLTNPPSGSQSPVIYAEGESTWVDADTSGERVSLYFSAPNGECDVSFVLPSGMGLDVDAKNDTSQIFITNKKGEHIGSVSVHSLATYDREALSAVDTSADSLPMPVFATIALSNHVAFDNYSVLSHSEGGAVARASYAWQDLNDESYDSAAEIPFNTTDCVLAYDYNASPYYFLFIVSSSDELSFTNGLNKIAETLQFSPIYTTAEPQPSPEPSAASDTRLDSIEQLLNSMPVNGMILSEYSDPRDMCLYEVLYQCSDDSVVFSDVYGAYKDETGNDVETDITYISTSELDKLLISLTGYGINDARNLDRVTYLESVDLYCVQHGDTNYSPVRCVSLDDLGSGLIAVTCRSELEDGELFCLGGDGEYRFVKEILVTLRETSGGYRLVSNKIVE